MTVTLVRKYGSAVERNRAKRVVREAYRHLKPSLETGYDLIVVLYPHEDSYHNRVKQLSRLCEKAGLFAGSRDTLPDRDEENS